MNFETRLNKAREAAIKDTTIVRLKSDVAINAALKRESIKILTAKLEAMYEHCELDLDALHRSISATRRSIYGRIPALINIIASTYAWPVEDMTEANRITEIQEELAEMLQIDGDTLLDLKEVKGFNSFLDEDTFEVIDGVEPDYEEYSYFVLTVADTLSLPFVDNKLTEAVYDKAEAKALKEIAQEQEAAALAQARHDEMMAS